MFTRGEQFINRRHYTDLKKNNNAEGRIKCYSKVSYLDLCKPDLNSYLIICWLVGPWASYTFFVVISSSATQGCCRNEDDNNSSCIIGCRED